MTAEPSEGIVDRHLRELFADAKSIEVVRSSHRVRNGVRVDRLVVVLADRSVPLVVKHYFGPLEAGQEIRPRLGLADDRQAKPSSEFEGLQRLHELQCSGTSKSRPVRPFHYDAQDRLLIMEEFPGASARELLNGDPGRIREAVRSGGEVLAQTHAMSHDGPVRREFAHEVESDFGALLRYVLNARSSRLHQQLETWWSRVSLPDGGCGPGHGDCSARNLLVSANGEVAWIDGLYRYGVPKYEDVATFTTSTRTTLRMFRRNGATNKARRSISDEFLRGYGTVSGTVDEPTLARFEVLVLLDRQASLLSSPLSMRTRFLLQLTDRELRSTIRGAS